MSTYPPLPTEKSGYPPPTDQMMMNNPPSYSETTGQPGPPGPTEVVHVVQQNLLVLGQEPVSTVCRNCHEQIVTEITKETGAIAYILAGVICVVGFWCGCCLLPLMADSLKDVTHNCPKCRAYLGKYKSKM